MNITKFATKSIKYGLIALGVTTIASFLTKPSDDSFDKFTQSTKSISDKEIRNLYVIKTGFFREDGNNQYFIGAFGRWFKIELNK